jgi:hypothetical protein
MKPLTVLLVIILLCAPPAVLGIVIVQSDNAPEEAPKDETPPVSSMVSTPTIYLMPPADCWQTQHVPFVAVCWKGLDTGSGIKHYDVQVIEAGINDANGFMFEDEEMPDYTSLMTETVETTTTFCVEPDHVYFFRVRATDNFGNVEQWRRIDTVSIVVQVPDEVIHNICRLLFNCDGGLMETGVGEAQMVIFDETAPVSQVEPLPPLYIRTEDIFTIQEQPTIQIYPYPPVHDLKEFMETKGAIRGYQGSSIKVDVSWTGTDCGSGIDSYDVQYKKDWIVPVMYPPEQPAFPYDHKTTGWVDWQEQTQEESAALGCSGTGMYSFRCRAMDGAGNLEQYPLTPDARTFVVDPIPKFYG